MEKISYKDFKNISTKCSEKKNKYRNKKVIFMGHKFDSVLEYELYLRLLSKYQKDDIELQKKFVLQEKFTKDNIKYRPIVYKADFFIKSKNKVYDAKGRVTKEFAIKKKIFEKVFPELTLEIITRNNINSFNL